MGNYLYAYRGGQMAASDEEREAVMAAWGAWFGGLGEAIVDPGAPFGGSTAVGGDGTAASALTGYTVIKADSLDAARALADGCPLLDSGGTVDVYEAMEMS
jgi:hypothetical protein